MYLQNERLRADSRRLDAVKLRVRELEVRLHNDGNPVASLSLSLLPLRPSHLRGSPCRPLPLYPPPPPHAPPLPPLSIYLSFPPPHSVLRRGVITVFVGHRRSAWRISGNSSSAR